MAGMGCYVGKNIMRYHDGTIVYDIYTKTELLDLKKTI